MSLDATKIFIITCCLFFNLPPVFSKEAQSGFSLMEKKSDKKNTEEATSTNNNKLYYLSSIIFYDDQHWTIWLNDQKINASLDNHLNLNLCVKSSHITIEERDNERRSPENIKKYKLYTNQTIDLDTGKIYNGDQRLSILKDKATHNQNASDGEDFNF